ncbi:MAG: rhodanese-like domain-containing protein [Acidimicrobiales bacterium]|jgi:rhodanese-related sulfurtransferase
MADITVDDAAAITESGGVLLDVRELDEWEAGHAPDAHFIPMSALAGRVEELPLDQPIAVICRSGGRSAVVTEGLLARGYDAANVAGGMQAWAAGQRPVVTDGGMPGVVI